MMFYDFWQNNSGGKLIINDKVAPIVWIEARNASEANAIAESIGIIFDEGCECCGDRWGRVSERHAYEWPEASFIRMIVDDGFPHTYIYFLDGSVQKLWRGTKILTKG